MKVWPRRRGVAKIIASGNGEVGKLDGVVRREKDALRVSEMQSWLFFSNVVEKHEAQREGGRRGEGTSPRCKAGQLTSDFP
ncbi:hypothetical protein [Corynebacterium mayonis]|uniref:hypothetical protein n=1 Tax=Corynebacterium mayonis TaxID=3062461 RepID=UPI00313FF478